MNHIDDIVTFFGHADWGAFGEYGPLLELRKVPAELVQLNKLEELRLNDAEVRDSTLPEALIHLPPSLRILQLVAGKGSRGELPSSWSALTNLTRLLVKAGSRNVTGK